MAIDKHEVCIWNERVSAWNDGELPIDQSELVLAHVGSCLICTTLYKQLHQFDDVLSLSKSVATNAGSEMNFGSPSNFVRVVAGFVGVVIIVASFPRFIEGSTGGDVLHDLRHLSIWQLAIGFGVLTIAFSQRISRLMAVVVFTFLLFTAIAVLYDLATGHNGPWTDPMHLVEIVALLAILRLISPFLFLSNRRQRKVLSRLQG